MKTLDRKAAEIFRALLALQTTKIDNSDGTYMPVYIELDIVAKSVSEVAG